MRRERVGEIERHTGERETQRERQEREIKREMTP
jgi:hypothetical protein